MGVKGEYAPSRRRGEATGEIPTPKAWEAGPENFQRKPIAPRAERMIMPLWGTQPHENGLDWHYPSQDRATGRRPSCLWCVEPENESGPTSTRPMSNPTLSPPLHRRGEHEEETAPLLRGHPAGPAT